MPSDLVRSAPSTVASCDVISPHAPTPMEMIAAIARDPSIPIERLQAVMGLQRQVQLWNAETAFNQAMRDAQAEMRPVVRDATNESNKSRYARLETIDESIRPIYTRHGFALTFTSPRTDAGGVTVECVALHSEGHSKTYTLAGGLDTAGPAGKPNKTPIQGLGSSVSYLKRYLTMMVFNIQLINEDDDGNSADPISEQQAWGIRDMLDTLAMEPKRLAKFWAWAEATSPENIQRRNYDRIHAELAKQLKAGGR
jgi:hypothetical protein